ARRDGAGADPRAAAPPARRPRDGDGPDHARPRRRRRDGGRGRRHVRRPDRRADLRERAVRRAAAPLRVGAAALDAAARRARRRGARADPRAPAVADPPADGLPLPPALPVRARAASHGGSAARGPARAPRRLLAQRGRAARRVGAAGGRRRPRAGARGDRAGRGALRVSELAAVERLVKRFPLTRGVVWQRRLGEVAAVDDVTLAVQEGESLGIVGETGSGKSTLARVLLNLTEPTGGVVRWRGEDVTHARGAQLAALRRTRQMVFQDPAGSLNPRKTVGAAIADPFAIHGLLPERSARARRVAELLEQV